MNITLLGTNPEITEIMSASQDNAKLKLISDFTNLDNHVESYLAAQQLLDKAKAEGNILRKRLLCLLVNLQIKLNIISCLHMTVYYSCIYSYCPYWCMR